MTPAETLDLCVFYYWMPIITANTFRLAKTLPLLELYHRIFPGKNESPLSTYISDPYSIPLPFLAVVWNLIRSLSSSSKDQLSLPSLDPAESLNLFKLQSRITLGPYALLLWSLYLRPFRKFVYYPRTVHFAPLVFLQSPWISWAVSVVSIGPYQPLQRNRLLSQKCTP